VRCRPQISPQISSELTSVNMKSFRENTRLPFNEHCSATHKLHRVLVFLSSSLSEQELREIFPFCLCSGSQSATGRIHGLALRRSCRFPGGVGLVREPVIRHHADTLHSTPPTLGYTSFSTPCLESPWSEYQALNTMSWVPSSSLQLPDTPDPQYYVPATMSPESML